MFYKESVVETSTKTDSRVLPSAGTVFCPKISELVAGFLKHGQFDLSWSAGTVENMENVCG